MEPPASGNMDRNLRNPSCLILTHTHMAHGVQRPELRRPFKYGGFLRPFYGVSTAVDKRPKLLRPRKLWVSKLGRLQVLLSFFSEILRRHGRSQPRPEKLG